MIIKSACETNVGMVRQLNEDSLFSNDAVGLWAVADGMGGHQAGDVASQQVVSSLGEVQAAADLASLVGATRTAIQQANSHLIQMSDEYESGRRPGSTVVALVINGDSAAIIWAGDSRIYRLRDGQAQQVSRDHSHVQELLDQELITPEEAEHHPMANVITRAVGIEEPVELDVLQFNAIPGDRFLLCSDGLSRLVTLEEIEESLVSTPVEEAASGFIQTALQRGASDNVTVVIVECCDSAQPLPDDDDATVLYPSGGMV